MKTIDEDIKSGQFKKIYLLYGDEAYLKKQYKDKLKKALVQPDDTMNFTAYEGKDTNPKEVIDLSETLPFFADRRVILIENSGFFKGSCEELAEYMPQVPDTTLFLFVEEEVDKRSRMYKAVKSHNPTALFGVSAQGNVTNNETQLYADVEKWSKEDGYVDYMAPQIYYGFDNGGQPFEQVVEQWDKMLAGTGKSLIPGLAVYKIGTEDEWAGSGRYEWQNDKEIIKRQILKSQKTSNYGGVILYSYQFIFEPDSNVKTAVNKEIAAFKPLLTQ